MATTSTTFDTLLSKEMLFEPVSQTNVNINDFARSFAPIASIQKGAPIEFYVNRSGQLYIDPEQTFQHWKVKLTKSDNAAIVGALNGRSLVEIVNNVMHSLQNEVSLMLNNKLIRDPSNMYAYRVYLEQLLNTTKDFQETRLLTEGFVKDKHTTTATNTSATDDSGLARRSEILIDESIIELYGRLHLDVFQQGKVLPPGLDLFFILILSDEKFAFLSSEDNAMYKYEIVFAELLVQTKQLNDALEAAQQAVMKEKTNMRIPYNRVYMKQYSIPTGLSNIAIDNVFTGALPDLAVIMLVKDEAFLGAYKNNPFKFKPFGLNRVELTRNSIKVPRFRQTPDFAKKLYTIDYANILQQFNFFDGDRAINITPEEWADGYTLFSLKLTYGPIGNRVDVPRAQSHSGAARLKLQFSAPTDKNLKVIVMYQMLEIIVIE